jgi:hypothetical protein
LSTRINERTAFGLDDIPTAAEISSGYYEPTIEVNLAVVDSLSSQGMFKFAVDAEHSLVRVEDLKQLCELYQEPKLFFVVPPR